MDPAATRVAAAAPVRPATWLKRALMYAFAAVCLAWVFHDVHPRQMLAAMKIANWWFVALAIAVDILTYVVQGVRWTALLVSVGSIDSLRATQAIYAGLFANEVMPLRLGEVVRAWLVSRWLQARMAMVLPSIVVERFLDAMCLAAGLGMAALFVRLPRDLLDASDILGVVVLAAAALFVWLVFRKDKQLTARPADRARSGAIGFRLGAFVGDIARGVRDIGLGRRFYLATLLSAVMLITEALAVWFMMLACGMRLPFGAGIIVFLVVRIGTAIPNAPANVGSFQFFTVVALGLFGVEKTPAAAFSIILFAVLTAPLWVLGLLAISRTGMSLADLRDKVSGFASRAAAV